MEDKATLQHVWDFCTVMFEDGLGFFFAKAFPTIDLLHLYFYGSLDCSFSTF